MSTVLLNASGNESQWRSFQILSSAKLNTFPLKHAFAVSFFSSKQRSRFFKEQENLPKIRSHICRRKNGTTRSLYSTFVESLQSPAQKAENSCFQATQLARENNVKPLDPISVPCETVSFTKSARNVVTKLLEDQSAISPVSMNPADLAGTEPLSYVIEDGSCPDVGPNLNSTKQPYWGAPSMSLSIGSSIASRRATYTMAAIGPTIGPAKMKGITGTYMVLTVAALGITKALINHFQVPQKQCTNCHGSGVEKCDFCKGYGQIEWEGKLRHSDPCPLCFGSRVRKCSACRGRHFGM